MFCEECIRIFRTVKYCPPGTRSGVRPELFDYPELENGWTGSHHISPGSFRSAVDDRCYLCYSIFRDCCKEVRNNTEVCRTFYEILSTSENRYALNFTVEILEGKAPNTQPRVIDCIGTFMILPKEDIKVPTEPLGLTLNTFSGKCESQVRQWLEDCDHEEAHCKCRQDWRTNRNYQLRLLRIGPKGSNKLTLETFDRDSVRPRYVTMSHCWGPRTATTTLLRSTEEAFKNGFPISDLPRKIRDAVTIATWMNADYLWVDALCIIQDDLDDWRCQSSVMGDIYASSYCNIAATSADPDRGCFTERLISIVEPHAMPDPRAESALDTHVIGYDDFWCNSLLDTTLHTRAWVLQERLLSPRTIYFGQEQIFWECRYEMACEAYPKGIPPPFRNHRMRSWRQTDRIFDPENRNPQPAPLWRSLLPSWVSRNLRSSQPQLHWAYRIFSHTIERYMECDLSFGHDKLVAISGIVQKVAQATGERYLAGHWDNPLLAQSLLWFVPSRSQANSKPSVRPFGAGTSSYRAPTWSWASIDAEVTWNWPADYGETVVDIINTTIEESGAQKMGAISAARMEVEGNVFPVELRIVSQDDKGCFVENGRYSIRLRNHTPGLIDVKPSDLDIPLMKPRLYLDEPMLPSVAIDAYLLPICTEWQGGSDYRTASLAGLLLKRADSSATPSQYERIGVFTMDRLEAQNLLLGNENREIITLV